MATECEYGRCGGTGAREASHRHTAAQAVTIGTRTYTVCEGCATLLIRDRPPGSKVTRAILDAGSIQDDEPRERWPLLAFVCPMCTHVLIEKGRRPRRRPCPQCACVGMEVTDANGLDALRKRFSAILIPKISGMKATELMSRFEGAWGRFNERQDDRRDADALATSGQKGKAYAQQVYQNRRRSSMEHRRKQEVEKPVRRRQKVKKPSLEELEHERREAEHTRVRAIRSEARRRKLR